MSSLTSADYDEMLRLEAEARAERLDVFDQCKNCPTPKPHRGDGFCSDKCRAEFAEVERRHNEALKRSHR
jgi:predicted nucleic acid-binding Zn ribbon protein